MKNASVHIKLEAPEVISIKKDVLLAEKDLLESIKYLKRYELLRKDEFLVKAKIRKELAALNSLIKAAEFYLPKEEKRFLKQEAALKEPLKLSGKKKSESGLIEKKKGQIEKEIDEIREKLAALGVSE
jgi:hypothetical protein